MEKIITYFSQQAKIACDEKCEKAWGGGSRPRVYLDISEEKVFGLGDDSIYFDEDAFPNADVDDYAYCSDDELPDAPVDPGTSEGFDKKPVNKQNIPNKWCIRECERCVMSDPEKYNEPLELKDFSKRYYNDRSKQPK